VSASELMGLEISQTSSSLPPCIIIRTHSHEAFVICQGQRCKAFKRHKPFSYNKTRFVREGRED